MKEMKVVVPKGYEIDRENSTFECIKFKPLENVAQSYEDVAQSLFKGKKGYYFTDANGYIQRLNCEVDITDANNATSKKQLEKLLAINKLMNVAKYLNGDKKLNWNDNSNKWFIYIKERKIGICPTKYVSSDIAYFNSDSLAQQAIDILGEDTIRLALSTDW